MNNANVNIISCELKEKIKELNNGKDKKITLYTISKLSNINYSTLKLWYENKMQKIDLNTLAKLCYTLNCEIGDLFITKN